MATVVAIHRIVVSDPNAAFVHSGSYDKNGNAILHKSSLYVEPGTVFEFPDTQELVEMIERGSMRYPTPAEVALHKTISNGN